MLEKGKPLEKVGRKVTDLSLRGRIRWQSCRATSEDLSSNPAIIQTIPKLHLKDNATAMRRLLRHIIDEGPCVAFRLLGYGSRKLTTQPTKLAKECPWYNKLKESES